MFISDTHQMLPQSGVPDGDILLHCGDFSSYGNLHELYVFNDQMKKLPHKHKIVIPGNHDLALEMRNGYLDDFGNAHQIKHGFNRARAKEIFTNCTMISDESVEIDGLKIYGSPWQPEFHDWGFNLPKGNALKEKWDLIPSDTDILLTHGPPYKILDQVEFRKEHVGCEELLEAVKRVKPLVHAFGHIHEEYGDHIEFGVQFLNVSTCNLQYLPYNRPYVVDISQNPEGKWEIDNIMNYYIED